MKILITEQQAELILTKVKELIRLVLMQRNILTKDIEVIPTFFPERGMQVKIKLENPSDKNEVREIVKDLLGGVGTFGEKKTLKITS